LHDPVIAAGAFDGDQAVAEWMLLKGLSDLTDGGVEGGPGMSDLGGRNQDAAIEVSEEELGTDLGTVETDDAEMFGSDLLDAGMEDAAGLADRGGS
jgi:hypothetical protein